MRFSTGSQTVRTAWLLKQHHTKETHRGLNTNILVMSFHYCFYIILIDPDCILPLFFLFCAEADPPLYMYAAIFFPLMFTGLATILLICFRRCVEDFPHLLLPFMLVSCVEILFCRKRDVIFPKIPEPRDLLSSIPDNNFKVSF